MAQLFCGRFRPQAYDLRMMTSSRRHTRTPLVSARIAMLRSSGGDDTTPEMRASWASSIAMLLEEIEQPQPLVRSLRCGYRKDVARACAPALIAIHDLLDDTSARVTADAMWLLREFLCDRAHSPLYGYDLEHARLHASELSETLSAERGRPR